MVKTIRKVRSGDKYIAIRIDSPLRNDQTRRVFVRAGDLLRGSAPRSSEKPALRAFCEHAGRRGVDANPTNLKYLWQSDGMKLKVPLNIVDIFGLLLEMAEEHEDLRRYIRQLRRDFELPTKQVDGQKQISCREFAFPDLLGYLASVAKSSKEAKHLFENIAARDGACPLAD